MVQPYGLQSRTGYEQLLRSYNVCDLRVVTLKWFSLVKSPTDTQQYVWPVSSRAAADTVKLDTSTFANRFDHHRPTCTHPTLPHSYPPHIQPPIKTTEVLQERRMDQGPGPGTGTVTVTVTKVKR